MHAGIISAEHIYLTHHREQFERRRVTDNPRSVRCSRSPSCCSVCKMACILRVLICDENRESVCNAVYSLQLVMLLFVFFISLPFTVNKKDFQMCPTVYFHTELVVWTAYMTDCPADTCFYFVRF